MVRTQIQLTEEQSRTLKRMAEKERVSMAELIRRSVDHYIATTSEAPVEERKRRLLSVMGIGHSDVSDLSTNHDKYLAEIYAEVAE